jgi:dihydrofolate reductase
MSEHGPLVRRVFESTSKKLTPTMSTQRKSMRKIRIIEHISLDGVIQGPGGPNEDDYPHGGWSVPFSDSAAGEAIVAAHGEAFDLLLGRRTYDIFSGYWPKAEKSPMADSLNAVRRLNGGKR